MNATAIKNSAFEALKGEFGYKSLMQAPRVTKIVVSTGVGAKHDPKKRETIQAKKSIATFKIRTGDIVGYQVTLRGKRSQDFLQKLIHIVLPRVKDFRGIKTNAIDEMGNITIGIREHTVFPETSDEDTRDIFGLAVTITTTAKNKKEAEAFLRFVGLPLQS